MSKILQVENLVQEFNLTKDFLDKVKFKNGHFSLENRVVHAVNNVSFDVEQGEVFSLVGESGCGKSTTARTIIKLIEPKSGKIIFDGRDITRLKPQEMRPIRREMQMIFQDPYASLNPRQKIMEILTDPMLFHKLCSSKAEAQEKAIHLLERVGLSSEQANRYPHQLSGGMRQRVMIAMALACEPDILIADEPTTALDVTIQAQILELMQELQKKLGMAIIMVTHDLGVIATMCDEIIVMYGGRVCERGTADEIFYNPSHEYTKGLLRSIPSTERMKERLVPIAGNPINLLNMPAGCAFCTRCDKAMKVCLDYVPMERQVAQDHLASCWLNDLALKDKAAEMAAAGESAEAVQLATGWVKNEGGEWVFDPIVAEEGGADDEQ